jgi:hypothetical protein
MPTKPQAADQPPPSVSVDPLADLREPDDLDRYADDDAPEEPKGLELTLGEGGQVLVTQEAWDEARAVVIAGWHADSVSLGFLHKGGNCGCRYLAGVALTAVLPVAPVVDELDPQGA